jgi:hypothetical protein
MNSTSACLAACCLFGATIVWAQGGAQPDQAPAPSPAAGGASAAQAPAPRPVGTMSELMAKIIYPTSDEIFYITRGAPKTEVEWNVYQGKMLMLAESANLLMMPGRARDQDRWMKDAKMLLDVGNKAFKAARAKDVAAIEGLSDELYNACVQCHADYRPNYRTRPLLPTPGAPTPGAP